MLTTNYQIINAQSLASSFNSNPINLLNVYNWSIQFVLTGSPVGSMKLQFSNDFNGSSPPLGPTPPTNWTDIATSVTAISAAGSFGLEDTGTTFGWIRAVYTSTSGSGNVSARINTRGV